MIEFHELVRATRAIAAVFGRRNPSPKNTVEACVVLSDRLHDAGEEVQRPRRAAILNSEDPGTPARTVQLATVQGYLPENYIAVDYTGHICVVGFDDHGWTLDGYVIPRLASGLIPAKEIK